MRAPFTEYRYQPGCTIAGHTDALFIQVLVSLVQILLFLFTKVKHAHFMSAKTKSMSLIKQLLRQHQQGKPVKFIARSLSISKNTVKAYLHRVRACALPIEQLLSLDDPELQGCLHPPANPACTDARLRFSASDCPIFWGELKRVGVTRKLLWQEYCATTSPPPGLQLLAVLLSA